ncbi:hypothetical protein NT6N_10460 [Oceaniferula spumae]|uniref:Ice-binding protein C-terminal domain-containing protein n=1 Tax=Oceaniferula spumae TaxID=2979115 RepID=A0AAT9FIW3_9BACT
MNRNTRSRAAGLSAVCAAVGITSALTQAAQGASLSTDLVINGGFESVNAGTTAGYSATEVNGGWFDFAGGSVFAYNYAQNYDDRDDLGTVPPGNDGSSATNYYFTFNTNDTAAIQNIDLSTGDTAAAILAGTGQYDIRGFFTNYADDLELGRLTLEFYDGDPGVDGFGATLVGSAINFDVTNSEEWEQVGGTGAIDSTAQWARIIVDHNTASGSSSGPDVYADNITFQVNVVPEPSSSLLALAGASLIVLRRRRH